MYELFLHLDQTVEFLRAYDGSTIDLATLHFYQELQEMFPNAKLILSVRKL